MELGVLDCAPKIFSCAPKIFLVQLEICTWQHSAPKAKKNFEPCQSSNFSVLGMKTRPWKSVRLACSAP